MMDVGLKVLSDLTIWSKYARYIPELQRRETWDEIVDRYEVMMMKKYPALKKEIGDNAKWIRDKKVLPSMRAMQFAGPAAEVNNARMYNCSYLPVDSIYAFSETMFLLLGGTGVGYSVQKHHVGRLPCIKKRGRSIKYLIQDSIIGWADAVKVLMKAYLLGHSMPDFDFRDIRPKGARLVTAGGKAPGPEPLKECLFQIQKILDRKEEGDFLTPLEVHDILCHIANSVLAGGIRRSACIALFSHDDEEMLTCKYGEWYELNEQRGRANNSAVLLRGDVEEPDFKALWERIKLSGSGEPGIYWTNDLDWGTNPCCEIALRPFSFCNLCEMNVDDVDSSEDLRKRAEVAAFFGTLQAGFTDFHYLRPIWKKTTEEDALLGIGQTGICSGVVEKLDMEAAVEAARIVNKRISGIIGINPATRLTCVKPSGTTSCVLGCSSGIHAWHEKYYLRTMRFNVTEEIAIYLEKEHPELCERDLLRPTDTLCVRIPIKAPDSCTTREETAIDTLERVKRFSRRWVKPGHNEGVNTHNVSATISLRDHEWDRVGAWMWENRHFYNGISVLPFSGGSYKQTPFEDISAVEHACRYIKLKNIDLTKVVEVEDTVNFTAIEACAGGKCEIG